MDEDQIRIKYSDVRPPLSKKWIKHIWFLLQRAADYFVLLCATVVRDAAGEVGVAGGTPVLQVFFLLSAENID